MSKKMDTNAVLRKDFRSYLLKAVGNCTEIAVDYTVALKALDMAIQKGQLTSLEDAFVSSLRVHTVDNGEQVKKSKIDISGHDNQWVTRDYEIVCDHLKMAIQLINEFASWDCEPYVNEDGELQYDGFDSPWVAKRARELLKVIDP